ncbi:MAG: hypothetical protein WCY58_09835 [Mariniphaga sp.]|nr:hypothetical protein [Mariniphaga sp.]MDD4225143.1 hypothetical protein [Mariniphaga sp.]
MKRTYILSTLIMLMVAFGCNKEDAITPSADFTTNLQNNTLKKGKPFTIYLDHVQGDFLVYFKGSSEENTYDAGDPTRLGTPFSSDLDSLVISAYNSPGEYVFTVVASSSGNWAKDYLQDKKSITINVEDE